MSNTNERNGRGQFTVGNRAAAYSDEEFDRLVTAYANHLANGFDKHSFADCDYRTVENSKRLTVLQTEKIRVGVAKGRYLYETMLRASVMGIEQTINAGTKDAQTIRGRDINVISLIFAMKNKYPKTYRNRKHE